MTMSTRDETRDGTEATSKRAEVERLVEIVGRWIRIGYEDNRRGDGHGPTSADAWHSALLRRMLSGDEPYPEPPPRMFSYPAYDFAAGERMRCYDVNPWTATWDKEDREPLEYADVRPGHVVLLNQSFWNVEDRSGDALLLAYPNSGWRGWLSPAPDDGRGASWHFRRAASLTGSQEP